MRSELPEWYGLSHDQIRQTVIEGTIVLDSSVLLRLYELGSNQRAQIIQVLSDEGIRSRLWVPHQVALEYQRNRVRVAGEQTATYKAVLTELEKSNNKINNEVQLKIRDKEVSKDITSRVDKAIQDIATYVKLLRVQHVVEDSKIFAEDPIRKALDELLDNAHPTGPAPSADEIASRTNDFLKNRKPNRIPPGYSDAEGSNKKINPEGDFLIWSEMLDHAKMKSGPILLVTDDEKEDWYQHDKDKNSLGPRAELRKEMAAVTHHHYHQETLEGFLRLAQRHLSAEIEESTIDQVGLLEEDRRRKIKLISKLRHPSLAHSFAESLNQLRPGTAAYQHVQRALEMIEGEREVDLESGEAALRILQSTPTSSPQFGGEAVREVHNTVLESFFGNFQSRKKQQNVGESVEGMVVED